MYIAETLPSIAWAQSNPKEAYICTTTYTDSSTGNIVYAGAYVLKETDPGQYSYVKYTEMEFVFLTNTSDVDVVDPTYEGLHVPAAARGSAGTAGVVNWADTDLVYVENENGAEAINRNLFGTRWFTLYLIVDDYESGGTWQETGSAQINILTDSEREVAYK